MKMFCYGASGHGKVVADILALSAMELLGFIDDDALKAGSQLAGVPVIGTASALPGLLAQGAAVIVTIGSNQTRTAKATELGQLGFKLATAIHPSAVVAHDVIVGAGTVIMAGAIVNSGSRIGANVIVNTGATLDHDCILADGVHISPGANLAGGVVVGANTHVGIRASVIQGINTGADSIVGAGATVIRNVPSGVTVVGSPARILNANHSLSSAKSKIFVKPDQSIRQTLQTIEESGLAIALVVDSQRRLLGTVTDGDVRRAILKQVDIASPITLIMNATPTTVTPAQDMQQIRDLLLTSTLKHVPVVDSENRVLDLITEAELLTVPMSVPDITDREIQAVMHTLQSRQAGSASTAIDFEEKLAAWANCRYAVAVNSGSSGLHLLVRALGLGPGDEVITTPFNFIASANCLQHENVTPRFVDINSRTYNIDPDKIEAAITPRTKMIIAADIFGQPADYDRIQEIAARHGLCLVIDACQSIGAEYKRRRASSHGVAAVFGFRANSQITTGEGGAIVTDDRKVAELCRSMRDEGCDTVGGQLRHQRLGYNYRLADLNSALGLAQLERIDEILEHRQQAAELYHRLLEGCDAVHRPYLAPETTRMSWFAYVICLRESFTRHHRDQVIGCLRRDGIEVNNFCSAIHLQPFYRRRFGFRPGILPVTEAISDRTLALPFHNHLRPGAAERVVKQLSFAMASIPGRQQNQEARKQRVSVAAAESSPGELTATDRAGAEPVKGTGRAC
jgi:perosamine synthetase